MVFVDDKIIEILQKLPSEGPSIDYKVIPYKKNQNHAFLQDVIAMLNSESAAGEDKFIIVGVTDSPRELRGIELEQWRDDNEWQNLVKKISPRPDVRTGYVKYQEMLFGYFYIPGSNNEWVYEANESVVSEKNERVCEKNIIAKGQAYTRVASINEVLMADGRKKLLEKKTQQLNLYRPFVVEGTEDKSVLIALSLVGGWNEKCSGDIKAIEILSGKKIEDIKRILRNENGNNTGNIRFSNGNWSVSDHLTTLLSDVDHIFDDHIDLYFEVIRSCFFEIDPKYDLPANQRSFSALLRKDNKRSYSDRITLGLAESLAILGNHDKAFTKCSRNKILNEIYRFERELFKTSDWRLYATISKEIQLLGEACPDAFMDEICRLLRTKDGAFLQYLSETEDSIASMQYGYEIGYTLAIIAKKEEYEILARGYCNPENQSAHFWYHFPVDTNELYDENDRLYMRSDGFDSIIYKYDEQDRVVEEEIVYNYFHSDSLAESIMDSIETNEEDYAYIDDVSDAVYGMEDILYDYVEPDYERIRYEYDDSGNCIKKLSYGGPEDDTLNWDCSYTYEGDKLVRESENDGREYTDYEYDGDTLIKESKYRNDSLYSTKKYYYDPEKKTKMILEEFTDPESENELTGIIYLNK